MKFNKITYNNYNIAQVNFLYKQFDRRLKYT